MITEAKCISLLKQHLGVFHHGLRWIPTHIKPVQSSSTQVNFIMQYNFGWILELHSMVKLQMNAVQSWMDLTIEQNEFNPV